MASTFFVVAHQKTGLFYIGLDQGQNVKWGDAQHALRMSMDAAIDRVFRLQDQGI